MSQAVAQYIIYIQLNEVAECYVIISTNFRFQYLLMINLILLSYGVSQTWSTLHSICKHIHSHIRKRTKKIQNKKFSISSSLRTSRNLSQHLQVSVVRIHPHTPTSQRTIKLIWHAVVCHYTQNNPPQSTPGSCV